MNRTPFKLEDSVRSAPLRRTSDFRVFHSLTDLSKVTGAKAVSVRNVDVASSQCGRTLFDLHALSAIATGRIRYLLSSPAMAGFGFAATAGRMNLFVHTAGA